MSCFPIKGD